jgi:predicted ATPase
VLADRLYDRDVPVLTSGVPLDRLFPDELLTAATARSTCGRSRGSRRWPDKPGVPGLDLHAT